MGTATLTLTDFLLARIAEDEANADCVVWDNGGMNFEPYHARVLAECEAKRRIVKSFAAGAPYQRGTDNYATTRMVTRLLALPYADHPDYRDEWKPRD